MVERQMRRIISAATLCALIIAGSATGALAHCDRINGPVAKDAVEALKQNDFSAVQIWVGEDQEEELRTRFDEARGTAAERGGT